MAKSGIEIFFGCGYGVDPPPTVYGPVRNFFLRLPLFCKSQSRIIRFSMKRFIYTIVKLRNLHI